MSNEQTVKRVRKHFAAHRTIARNLRLRRYEGRNGVATEQALQYHFDTAQELLRTLPRDLQGNLTAEHGLAGRLSQARDDGQRRPELQRRLKAHRNLIRELA